MLIFYQLWQSNKTICFVQFKQCSTNQKIYELFLFIYLHKKNVEAISLNKKKKKFFNKVHKLIMNFIFGDNGLSIDISKLAGARTYHLNSALQSRFIIIAQNHKSIVCFFLFINFCSPINVNNKSKKKIVVHAQRQPNFV